MGDVKYLSSADFVIMEGVVRNAAEAAGRGYVLMSEGWTHYVFPEKSVCGVYVGVKGDNAFLAKAHIEGVRNVSAMMGITSGWKESVKYIKELYSKSLWSGHLTFLNMTGRGAIARVVYDYDRGKGNDVTKRFRKKDGYRTGVSEVSGFYPLYQYCKEHGHMI